VADGTDPTLLLVSRRAFYPVHAAVVEELAAGYAVNVAVLGAVEAELPDVHRSLGWASPEQLRAKGIRVELLPPDHAAWSDDAAAIRACLGTVDPDLIWVQEEPVDLIALEVLAAYRRVRRRPLIGCAVCENIFVRGDVRTRLRRRHLWSRLDVLLPVAHESVKGIRAIGMPATVSTVDRVAGIDVPVGVTGERTARTDERFRVGFVGRLVAEKGWRDALAAVSALPDVTIAFAGDGPDRDLLVAETTERGLGDRAEWVGLLAKDDLWDFYRSLGCLVVPSRTTEHWKEQFGAVIADAFACGVPVVGSDSGAIPEVIGAAGLVFPEGDVEALGRSIAQIRDDASLRVSLAQAGRERYEREFSVRAYAAKIARAFDLQRRNA
jgi:glycosyltransferase involved in cell wall biosynthesis